MSSDTNIIKFHWSSFCLFLSVGLSFLFSFIIYKMLTSSNLLAGFILSIIILVIVIYFVLQCPISIVDSTKRIEIKLIGKTIDIHKKDILYIKEINRADIENAYRACGSGGFLGFTGKFKSPDLGVFYMYATELKNLLLIVTEERKYIISCSDNIRK